MRWLVDGYNVIRRDPDLRGEEAHGLEAGRRALLGLLREAAERSGDIFTVVFDGAPGPGAASPAGQIQVVFSRPPENADDVLRRLAGQWREAAVVVTSDRAVQGAARRLHCVVVGADEFVAALGSGAGPAPGEDEELDDEDERRDADRKRGNPRRLSRDVYAARRVLRRLRGG